MICLYAKCCVLLMIMLNIIMLNVVVLSVLSPCITQSKSTNIKFLRKKSFVTLEPAAK
jgi:hypothetical protein